MGSAWLMVAAAVLIAVGTVANEPDVATLLVVLALGAVLLALLSPAAHWLSRINVRSVRTVLAVGITLEAIVLAARPPVGTVGYSVAVVILAAIGIHAVLGRGRIRSFQLAAVIVGHLVLMLWMIWASGVPDIDVFAIQQEGSAALVRGVDPYAITFATTAPPDSPYYASELIVDHRLGFGVVYPPVSLLMAVPGYVFAGDYRYGAALAIALTALVILLIRPSATSSGAALLLTFAPMTQQILYWGWSESFVVLLLATTVALALRRRWPALIALGLFVAAKQYAGILYPLAITQFQDLRQRIGWRTTMALPVGVAVASVIPFLAWDPGAFVHSTVVVLLLQPFRADSVSVSALLVRAGLPEIPAVAGFVIALAGLGLSLWKGIRNPAGFCLSATVVLLLFFLFGKYAHINYYLLPLVALACGIAATPTRPDTTA